jgi:outer membrane receptor for ferrienterochelin and colicin
LYKNPKNFPLSNNRLGLLMRIAFIKVFQKKSISMNFQKIPLNPPKRGKFFVSLFLIAGLCCIAKLQAQTVTISGYIEDAQSSERLISAAIFDAKTKQGVVTNTFGFYSLTLPKGDAVITVSYIGYQPQQYQLKLRRDTVMNISLVEGLEMQTVEVNAKKQNRIENQVQTSKIVIPIEQIKKIPALFGEVDVLKVLQLLPGVQAGGEGQNGLYVRGGSPDQNLILLDGVPIYNVSHVGGLFSVFNGNAIKNVTLTKGGFPARYGGRLSSVIEIDMKEGNMKKFQGEGSIGIISSNVSIEGPIKKDVASFIVSARRTYIDAIIRPIIAIANSGTTIGRNGVELNRSVDLDLYFYDLNAKVNWKINNKHRLFLSAYTGRDVLGIGISEAEANNDANYNKTDAGINWGNLTAAFRWNWLIGKKMFSNATVTYSNYNVNTLIGYERQRDGTLTAASGSYVSGIKDWSARYDLDYIHSPKHKFKVGFGGTYHTYNPGAFQINATIRQLTLDTVLGSTTKYSFEPTAYIEDEMQIGKLLKANIGLHASAFLVDGVTYSSLQPRINLNYPIGNNMSLKASFATMQQYINLLTNESVGLPTDLWVPSTSRVKPQKSWQAVVGAAETWKDEYEVSIEAFYKKMDGVISYKEGSSFAGTQTDWQDKIVQGKGEAYGAEFFVQRKEGQLTGWIGYTLSWNNRQFDDINSGIKYPFKYDRRHDFKAVGSYKFSDKFTFTASWVYGTGNSITLYTNSFSLPTINAQRRGFDFQGTQYAVSSAGERNAFRMPAYHRLDVSFEWTKKKRLFTRIWTVGAYNAYSRANPYALYQDTQAVNGRDVPVYRQFSILPIVPSVSYGFKF